MRRIALVVVSAAALALAGTAAAALSPWTFDPGNTGCPTSTFSNGVLHLAKNCPTATNASAGATVTGFSGQTFTSASFTLANAGQCQGGSPRFNVGTSGGLFFLGCNTVTPTMNADGTATYAFTPANLVPQVAGSTVGTITTVDVVLDVQGAADLTNITVNGQAQNAPAGPTSKNQCKHGGWKTFTSPSFKNQGQCIKFVKAQSSNGHKGENGNSQGHDSNSQGHHHK
jgi:hypothetical protein